MSWHASGDFGDVGVGWSWGVEVDGIETKGIQEVSGLKQEVDEIDSKQNLPDGKYILKRMPGRMKPGEITLTRGLSGEHNWLDWMEKIFKGDVKGARKNGVIKLYDFKGEKALEFKFTNGWPKDHEIGTLKAGDTSVLTEKITIVHEGLEKAP